MRSKPRPAADACCSSRIPKETSCTSSNAPPIRRCSTARIFNRKEHKERKEFFLYRASLSSLRLKASLAVHSLPDKAEGRRELLRVFSNPLSHSLRRKPIPALDLVRVQRERPLRLAPIN